MQEKRIVNKGLFDIYFNKCIYIIRVVIMLLYIYREYTYRGIAAIEKQNAKQCVCVNIVCVYLRMHNNVGNVVF